MIADKLLPFVRRCSVFIGGRRSPARCRLFHSFRASGFYDLTGES